MTTLDRIKFLMQERGWSQGQLAKMAGLPRSTVTNMFRRETEPSLTSLIAIGKAFGLTPMQVLSMGNTMVELTPEQQEFFMDWGRAYRRTKTDRRGSGAAVSSDKAVNFYNCREMSTPAANGLPEFFDLEKSQND